MTKKILMLGSSIVCSLGICLAALTLTSAVVEKVYANVEMPAEGQCNAGGGICISATCNATCPDDYPTKACTCQ